MQQFTFERISPGYLRVTFDRPPINLVDQTTIEELGDLCSVLETDPDLRVAVITSANPDYFMARYDFSSALPDSNNPFAGLRAFAEVTKRLEQSPVVTIASIRGRARGGGNELALACDLRFASRGNTLLAQPEVPSGLVPAGGGIERLAARVGRARAMEIVITGDDYNASTAELYGWINRAIPDAELDAFVDTIARRIAGFDRSAVASAKALVGRFGRINESDLREDMSAVPELFASTYARRAELRERAERHGAEFELDLGYYLGVSSGEQTEDPGDEKP